MKAMKKSFTLIELMIVVAIIAIIAAIAIPNLLQSRLLANESAAIAGLKTIHTEMNKFKQANFCMKTAGTGAMSSTEPSLYADNLLALWDTQIEDEGGTPKSINLISEVLAKATAVDTAYKGYVFVLDPGSDKNGFIIYAYPAVYSKTGIKTFYINEEGTVYSSDQTGPRVLIERTAALAAADHAAFLALSNPAVPTGGDVWTAE